MGETAQDGLDGRRIVETFSPQAELDGLELAGCYVIVTDVPKERLSTEAVHASYRALRKTGLLEIRPLFVRKENRTRGHVFCCLLALKLQCELERRLVAVIGTTAQDPNAVSVSDALAETRRAPTQDPGCPRSQLAYQVERSQAENIRPPTASITKS